MNPAIFTHPAEVYNRIAMLGLSQEHLVSIAVRMAQARTDCTANNPPSAPGFYAWSEGTRRARELFIPLGWEACEYGQLSSIYNRKTGVRMIVINADAGAGLEDSQPQNRTYKRSATDRAVVENRENFLFDINLASNPQQPPCRINGAFNWYLFVFSYRDEVGDILRAELSLPSSITRGFFTSFHERIMVISDEGFDEGSLIVPEDPEGDPEFEIHVTRKEA